MSIPATTDTPIMTCAEVGLPALRQLLQRYQLQLVVVDDDQPLPGSFWGDPEAGLIGPQLFIRPHTPIQSALHEACHYICMDQQRRNQLHTDAGGGYDEENSVCYLQILLADHLPGMNRQRMMRDMDQWGYTFRLGSARRWFEQDAEDARHWLMQHGLIDDTDSPRWNLRDAA